MEEVCLQPSYRPQVRQPASVPFLWEEKPGTPKREWKSEVVTATSVPSPAKLVVSVPFSWEEKPGKPLFAFSPLLSDSQLLPRTPSSSPSTINGNLGAIFHRTNPFLSSDEDDDDDSNDNDDGDGDNMSELDLESFIFDTDDPFSSTPSLLANGLITTTAVSNAVPLESNESLNLQMSSVDNGYDQRENWIISLSDVMNNSRYTTSGDSVLGFLFPLLSPDSAFLNKVGCRNKNYPAAPPALLPLKDRDDGCKRNRALTVRRPHTLGELMEMSRRINYGRKAVQIKKQSFSLEFMRLFACCIFGANSHLKQRHKLQ